ncbi:MAG: secretin and TonB N-terminal domain-containing protein [bacterium]
MNRRDGWRQAVGMSVRLLGVGVVWAGLSVGQVLAQAQSPGAAKAEPSAELVTINVDDGMIVQVLNAFSRQTGRSIVVGPEVTGKVTARLSNVQWRDALDSILKPYGYGYYLVGDTIIVTALDKLPKGGPATVIGGGSNAPSVMPAVLAPQPKVLRVFTLKYLDVADIKELIEKLSPGITIGRLVTQSQSWKETGGGAQNNTTSESLGRLNRFSEDAGQVKGKTFAVVDTADVIKQVEAILEQLDRMPTQVQIEAKFVEVRADLLRDIGFEWGTGAGGASSPGVKTVGTTGAGKLYAAGGQQVSGGVKPAGFSAQSSGVNGTSPFNAGLSLAFQKLTDFQFEVLLHLLEEDSSYNVLSSPRVLTMNNQDAVIIVGTKLPIIKSTTESSSGGAPTTSTSLERYEDIGIKLKVLPQVCDDNYINLIVHPSVRDLLSYQSGKVSTSGGGNVSLTEYPVVATREAETQVMVKSGQTIVLGGMIRESKQNTQLKVPFLGSIPLLGVLFRRDTVSTEKIELLIFLTAKVRDPQTDDGATTGPEKIATK